MKAVLVLGIALSLSAIGFAQEAGGGTAAQTTTTPGGTSPTAGPTPGGVPQGFPSAPQPGFQGVPQAPGQFGGAPIGTPATGVPEPPRGPQGGVLQQTGGFVSGGAIGEPLVVTPSATFVTPPPTAGITNLDRAGVTNRPEANANPLGTTVQTGTMSYYQVPLTPPVTVAGPDLGGEPLGLDEGMLAYRGAEELSEAAEQTSLAEYAEQFRDRDRAAQFAGRVITNEDIARLPDTGGVTSYAPPASDQGAQQQQQEQLPASDQGVPQPQQQQPSQPRQQQQPPQQQQQQPRAQ